MRKCKSVELKISIELCSPLQLRRVGWSWTVDNNHHEQLTLGSFFPLLGISSLCAELSISHNNRRTSMVGTGESEDTKEFFTAFLLRLLHQHSSSIIISTIGKKTSTLQPARENEMKIIRKPDSGSAAASKKSGKTFAFSFLSWRFFWVHQSQHHHRVKYLRKWGHHEMLHFRERNCLVDGVLWLDTNVYVYRWHCTYTGASSLSFIFTCCTRASSFVQTWI